MDRAEFERRFREAADHAVTFAREFVEERLPDRVRLDLRLNSSYDAHANADEVLYPDDHRTVPRERVTAVSVESAADLLYRDGRVPGWIDLSARAEDGESTILEARCCGRFTANDDQLYHRQEGRPPFHVVGPALPPDWDRESRPRFSLYHRFELTRVEELARLERARFRVQQLLLNGPGFTDATLGALGDLPRIKTLTLSGTNVTGKGLDRFTGLSCLVMQQIPPIPLALGSVARLQSITNLSLSGEPTAVEGLQAVGQLKRLESLYLPLPRLESVEFISGLSNLWSLTLSDAAVRDLSPLAALQALKTLDLARVPAAPEEFRHLAGLASLSYCLMLEGTSITDVVLSHLAGLRRLGNLILRNTGITDASLGTILGFPKLTRLDIRGTRMSAAAFNELKRAMPGISLFSDHE